MPCSPRLAARIVRFGCLLAGAIAIGLFCAWCISEIDRPVAKYISIRGNPQWALAAETLAGLSAAGFFTVVLGLVYQHIAGGELESSRNRLIAAFTSVIAAVGFAGLLNVLISRIGPSEYLTTGAYGFRYLTAGPGHSFPSEFGVLTGVATVMLWKAAPTYRPTILLLALILPASQLLSGAYFVSDLMAGLGIGVLVAFIVNEAFRKRVHVDNE